MECVTGSGAVKAYLLYQRILTVEGSISVRMVYSFSSLNLTASLHNNNNVGHVQTCYMGVQLNSECSLV